MNKEVKIGALVLVVAVAMIWGYNFLKGQDIFSRSLNLETNYAFVDQLSPSSPVLINGVKVGNVTAVDLDQNNVNNVVVKFTIENVGHIPKNAVAALKSTGVMGGKALTIEFDKPCSGNGDCLEDGDKLQSKSVSLINSMLGENTLDGYMETAQDKIQNMFGGEDGGESDFNAMFEDLQATIASLNEITQKLNVVLASSTYDVKNVTKNLSSLSNTLASSSRQITDILANVEEVTVDLKNANIAQTVESANSALSSTNAVVDDLKGTIATTNQTMAKVNDLVTKVESGQGSLGKLVNDEELYKELENTSEEIGLLLQDLRLNPKRYINVSVFGKKQKDYTLPEEDPANN
jgi:phospholipid/cholesterol/gamma-HCH transport system substrate-binding protein